MAGSVDKYSDDYVAKLLQKDADATSREYKDIGTSALLPKRPTGTAPKPNKHFLKTVLKNTTQHNAALQVVQDRREEDVRARRRERERMEAEKRSRAGRLTPPLADEDEIRRWASRDRGERHAHRKRRRDDDGNRDQHQDRDHRHSKRPRKDSDRQAEGGRKSRRDRDGYEAQDEEQRKSHGKGHLRRSHRRSRSESDESNSQEKRDRVRIRRRRSRDRHRDDSRSRLRARSESRDRHRRHKQRRNHSHARSPDRVRSKSPGRHRSKGQRLETTNCSTRTRPDLHPDSKKEQPSSLAHARSRSGSKSSASSDPLERLVGPLPASQDNQPRPRGRGALKDTKSSSAIDAHFSSAYDPSHDQGPSDSDDTDTGYAGVTKGRGQAKEDDWDMAMEALRDREKWRAKGAERMREAGWGDDVVKTWEENAKAGANRPGTNGTSREKDENDVVWAKRGEGREWDKGKVIDSDGDGEVELKPEWAKRSSRSESEYGRLL